jgi:hypothetical protein
VAVLPQPTAPTPVLPPAPVQPRQPADPMRRNMLIVAVAALLVVAGVVTAILLLNDKQPADNAAQHGSAPQTSQQPSPSQPESSQPPASTQSKPIAPNSPIGFSEAGGLVINYYGDVQNAAKRFAMLSSNAQAQFGGLAGFKQYWSQYSQVSSRNANGVTPNADGSVNVPVDVTYTKGDGSTEQHQQVRVTRENGKLVIDSKAS